MAPKAKQRRVGKQPPRYRFFLNPYQDVRFTVCPGCGAKTRQRKLPLFIHVVPFNPVVVNKTCRYCPACDLLIAHQDEVEAFLAAFFAEHNPEVIGNDYLALGTLDPSDWQRGTQSPLPVKQMLERLHDFTEVVQIEPGRVESPRGTGT